MRLNLKKLGMDSLLKMADSMDERLDKAIEETLEESADVLLEDMRTVVQRHYKSGAALRAIKRTKLQREGDFWRVDVGAPYIRKGDEEGFHVIYLEYGSPTLVADPWLSSAIEKNRAKLRKIRIDALKRNGILRK